MAKFFYEEGILPHLGILLTTACNLNCKDCADLIPYRAISRYKKEEVIQDLNKVLESVSYIREILLIGGEVFLYSELSDILDYCKEQKKIGKIILTTNGTIIPDTYILNSLKHSKVILRISGYNNEVSPQRENLFKVINSYGIQCQNLDGMIWYDIGKNNFRNRSDEQLYEVFQSCGMSTCVCMNNKGEIFFCSRQMAAKETDFYPTPYEEEYIMVRELSIEQLRLKWKQFYTIPFISTCNYCDGITSKSKPILTAIQIVDKEVFLLLLQLMEELRVEQIESMNSYIFLLRRILNVIKENINQLLYYKDTHKIIEYIMKMVAQERISYEEHRYFYQLFRNLVRVLSKQFQYDVECRGDFCRKYRKDNKIYNKRNVIKVLCIDNESQIVETQADLILTQEDLLQDMFIAYPIDEFRYNRIYLQSWFQLSKGIVGIVSGLSYVQYGIIVEQFKYPTANIAVGGMDINYSIQMVNKFLDLYSDVKYVILPISYYEGFYDMDSSKRTFHKLILETVIWPVLMDKPIEENNKSNSIFSSIMDIDKLYNDYEEEQRTKLWGKSYFNEFHQCSKYGGVDFKNNTEEENYQQAMKTVKGNESVYKEENKTKILSLLKEFLDNMEKMGIKVLFFTPPITKYVFESMNDTIEENFYKYYIPFFKQYTCCTYLDYYRDKDFSFFDFRDYEHLGKSGAYKLTKKINEWVEKEFLFSKI